MDWHNLISALFFAGAFFWASCPCCPANCGTGCSSTPTEIAVTLSGFTNNSCSSCADYNATYICPPDPTAGAGVCQYRVLPAMSCEVPPGADLVQVTLSSFAGQTTIGIIFHINARVSAPFDQTSITWQNLTVGAARQDCKNLGTVNVPWQSSTASSRCTHDNSDASVTFS